MGGPHGRRGAKPGWVGALDILHPLPHGTWSDGPTPLAGNGAPAAAPPGRGRAERPERRGRAGRREGAEGGAGGEGPASAAPAPAAVRRKDRWAEDSPSKRDSYVWREVLAAKEKIEDLERQNLLLQEALLMAEQRAEAAEDMLEDAVLGAQRSGSPSAREGDLRKVIEDQSARIEDLEASIGIFSAEREAAVAQAEALRKLHEGQVLDRVGSEEVHVRRALLAYYWGLAERHRIYLEVAPGKAAYWAAKADAPPGGVLELFAGGRPERRALFADMVKVERGMRELLQLRLLALIGGAMKQRNRPRLINGMVQPQTVGTGEMYLPLSEEQVHELRVRTHWVAFIWGMADRTGVEAHVSGPRRRRWEANSREPVSLLRYTELDLAMQEIHLLGIENKVWEARRRDLVGGGGAGDDPYTNVVNE